MLEVCVRKQRGDFLCEVAFTGATPGVTALFGRSGCGKTTTIHMIAGLLRPDHGHIRVADTVLFDAARGIDVPAEERGIGYVFQDARLFPHLSVRDNLRYGERRARRGAHRLKFDAVVELLGLASLLAQPRLLLLDEPLAALDGARRGELLPYLEGLRDRFSLPMVYVSHQLEEVLRLAGHVVVMESGHVADHGDVVSVSQSDALRAIVGAESMGAVVEGTVGEIDTAAGLAHIQVGDGQLRVEAADLRAGQRLRVQLLARDLIVSIAAPAGLSVRNSLAGVITQLQADGGQAWLVFTDIGGARLMVRITDDARRALDLAVGQRVWVLVKTISLRGHVFSGPANG